jgi:hypothetical protein
MEESMGAEDVIAPEPRNGGKNAAGASEGGDCGDTGEECADDGNRTCSEAVMGGKGKARANARVKGKGVGPGREPVKAKGTTDTDGRKRKSDCTADQQKCHPAKKWKTDGHAMVVDHKAEALIVELATISDRHRGDDLGIFLCAIGSATPWAHSFNANNTFPSLVKQCGLHQTNSTVADFFHMVSLILLALFIDGQVDFFVQSKT